MSSTHSSPLSNSAPGSSAIRQLVAERVGRQWCLFLDRDGVLNRRIVGDYVRSWQDFVWLPGARLAVKALGEWAPHLVVVTNQQGIGKGLMGADDVAAIHHRMRADLALDGAVLEGVQVCPHLVSAGCECRKPRPGLVLEWLAQHPENESALSMMVGDSQSDLELAHNVAAISGGCAGIQIGGHFRASVPVDASFESLADFAAAVRRARAELESTPVSPD